MGFHKVVEMPKKRHFEDAFMSNSYSIITALQPYTTVCSIILSHSARTHLTQLAVSKSVIADPQGWDHCFILLAAAHRAQILCKGERGCARR